MSRLDCKVIILYHLSLHLQMTCSGMAGGICTSADDQVVLFALDLSTLALSEVTHITTSAPGCSDVAIRADQRIFALASWTGQVSVYHMRKRRLLAVLQVGAMSCGFCG